MIPSYDDLTPGIPDVLSSESVSQLALFLREDLKKKEPSIAPKAPSPSLRFPSPPSPSIPSLYGCLRLTANCERHTVALLSIAQDFSPRVMRVGDGEILLDVSGLGRLIGAPTAIAAALTRAMGEAGLAATARVAIAPTQTGARLMAVQAGLTACATAAAIAERDIASALAPLAVSLLGPLEAVPKAITPRDRARPYDTFERWGIATLGDLAALPAAELSSRLGRRGIALQRLARGLDPRPFVPDADTPRYRGRLELEWPLEALEPLSFVFARLLEPLSAALERADRAAAAIRLELRLTTRATHARVLQLPAAMRDPRVLRTLLLLDLESHPPSAAVDIVSIELDPAPARITQFSLLERAVPSPETLSTLTARLSALVGESRIGSAVLLDSHRPDAFAMAGFRPDLAAFVEHAGAPAGAFGGGGTVRSTGGSVLEGSVLRRQRHPPAIRVSVERGRPVYLAAARRGMPQGAVTQAAGPWRTSGGWWTGSGAGGWGPGHGAGTETGAEGRGLGHGATEGGPVPPKPRSGEGGWNRDEWDVALASGAVCRIYQDRTNERWFFEGFYD